MMQDIPKQPVVAGDSRHVGFTARRRRVLIVEDNLDSVRTLAALVADMGHRVEYAINGYVAVEVAKKFKPEVVLLDLGLPGMDGYEVCSRLKADPTIQPLRIIAVTAYGHDAHRVRARAAGCDLHLVKPVPVQTLFDVLEQSPA